MKLSKDNYELLMFDLLEGNIPEGDVDMLMDQIENDSFYKREWELMQATILQPDLNIQYPAKDELLKKESKIIPMRTWMSIAVAASVVFALFIYIPRSGTPEEIGTAISKTPAETHPTVEETTEETPEAIFVEETTTDEQANVHYATTKPKVEVQEEQEDPVFTFPAVNTLDSRGMAGSFTENTPSSTIAFIPSTNVQYLPYSPVTNGYGDRLISTAVVAMARLRNPQLSLNPDWKKKKLDIKFESDGYYALASVTPFNK